MAFDCDCATTDLRCCLKNTELAHSKVTPKQRLGNIFHGMEGVSNQAGKKWKRGSASLNRGGYRWI